MGNYFYSSSKGKTWISLKLTMHQLKCATIAALEIGS